MIVVTGASGFIGTNLSLALKNTSLIAVDIRTSNRVKVDYIHKDNLLSFLNDNVEEVECIYHLGGDTSTTSTDYNWIMSNNTEYTRSLWLWCTEFQKPFLYASSAATYGDGSRGYDDKVNPSIYTPLNLYACSKHIFDIWALQQKTAPPKWIGVKYFNVYGPYEDHKGPMASMAYLWFQQVKNDGEARLFRSYKPDVTDGEQKRDFVYISDVVDATVYLMNNNVKNGLYNIGTGQARTFSDFARAMFAAMSSTPNLRFIDMPDNLVNQYQYFTEADISKLRYSGYDKPFLSVEEGTKEYVKYLK